MASLITQKNLLLLLAALLGVKFILIPILEWQNASIEALNAASRQLNKIERVISDESRYREELEVVRVDLDTAIGFLYEDSDTVKLDVQRDIEKFFNASGRLKVTGFNWVMDSTNDSGSVRVLRGIVYFSGPMTSIIDVFWALGASSKIVKIVDWRQQVKNYGLDVLGVGSGNATLEFFVSTREPFPSKEVTINNDG